MSDQSLAQIERTVIRCQRCPELREYCAEIGRERRKAYADWDYWARPVSGFGDHAARILIVGLAPAAHGANRTGRMFTGDRSGDFLYGALHRADLANQPDSSDVHDGLKLQDVYITAALRCAPPHNKPTSLQLSRCADYLHREVSALKPKVILALGGLGWNAVLKTLRELNHVIPTPRPKFGHGAEIAFGSITLLGCYHVSQQNTFTGRLTKSMIDIVLKRAKAMARTS